MWRGSTMISRAQKIRLGLFITAAFLVILVTVAVLSLDRVLNTRDLYYIAYNNQSLSGLDIGSQVKYMGISVGTVRDLRVNHDNITEIIVTIAINPSTPIRRDMRADLATMGITGIKSIEISAGDSAAPALEPGSFIQAGRSVTDELIEKVGVITQKIDHVLDNMLALTEDDSRDRILAFIDEAYETIVKINRMIDNNQERMERTVTNVDSMATELNRMVASAHALLNQTETVVSRNRGRVTETLDELHMAIRSLNNTARIVQADPSVLLRGMNPDNPPDDRLGRR
jgi:phospholipid/cholesterol/gamma-HCH transport system substrate-binding protein